MAFNGCGMISQWSFIRIRIQAQNVHFPRKFSLPLKSSSNSQYTPSNDHFPHNIRIYPPHKPYYNPNRPRARANMSEQLRTSIPVHIRSRNICSLCKRTRKVLWFGCRRGRQRNLMRVRRWSCRSRSRSNCILLEWD